MTTHAQSNERLLKLAWLLDNLTTEFPGAKFSLSKWVTKLVGKLNGKPTVKCGTVACACGWAGLHPWFRCRGLKTSFITDEDLGDHYVPEYKDQNSDMAIANFFGIYVGPPKSDVIHLFYCEAYYPGRSRRDVARRIRKFVRDRA